MLDVPLQITALYNSIDKDRPIEIDHQLAVDIPRCHQYVCTCAVSRGAHSANGANVMPFS
jgi:hypothetical protein